MHWWFACDFYGFMAKGCYGFVNTEAYAIAYNYFYIFIKKKFI